MKFSIRKLFAVLFLLLFVSQFSSVFASDFAQVVKTVRSAESYRVTANIEQHLLPKAGTLGSVREERIDLYMRGTVAGDSFDLELAGEDSRVVPPSRIFADESGYYIERQGQVERLDDSADIPLASSLELLAFLDIASSVQEIEPITRNGETFTVFAFEIEGLAYAEMMRQFYMEMFAADLPPNTTLQHHPTDLATTGTGEIWIGSDGLPVREIISLHRPNVTDLYDVTLTTTADFTDFGGITEMPAAMTTDDGSLVLTTQPIYQPATFPELVEGNLRNAQAFAQSNAIPTAVLFTALLLTGLSVAFYLRKPRLAYTTVAAALSFIMLTSPLLQSVAYARANTRSAERQAEFETQQTAQAAEEARQAEIQQLIAPYEPTGSAVILTARSDQDGRAPSGDFVDSCGTGSTSADSDGDGLSDFDEGCLGTNPYLADTDRDLISDFAEVTGFTVGGKEWFGDPFEPDSNRDGVPDFAEWSSTTYTLTSALGTQHVIDTGTGAANWDFDNDGTPDLWDDDNDNDGVLDSADISPNQRANGFVPNQTITIDGTLNADEWQMVHVQMRPQNPDHLRYSIGTLDWPQDSEGQVTDRDNTPNDVRLVPMLQLTTNERPGDDTLYAYQPAQKTDGNWVTLVPVAPTADRGRVSTFAAKLAFPPTTDATVNIDIELIWVVSQSDEGGAVGSTRMLQLYRGEDFELTGVTVERSSPVEVAYFATPDSPDEDDRLFRLLYGLNATFMDSADYPISEVFNNIDAEILDDKWGVTGNFQKQRLTYDHIDRAYLSARPETFIDAAFSGATPPARCPSIDGSTPDSNPFCASIVVASDYNTTSYNYDAGGGTLGNLTINMAAIPTIQQRAVRLAVYQRTTPLGMAADWQSVTNEQLVSMVVGRYRDVSAELAALGNQAANVTDQDLTINALVPYTIWTGGRTTSVAINNITLPSEYTSIPEIDEQAAAFFETIGTSISVPLTVFDLTEGLIDFVEGLNSVPVNTSLIRQLDDIQKLVDAGTITAQQGQQQSSAAVSRWTQLNQFEAIEAKIGVVTMITGAALVAANVALSIVNAVCASDDQDCDLDESALEAVNWAIQGVTLATAVVDLTVTTVKIAKFGLNTALDISDTVADSVSIFAQASKVGQGLLIVGYIFEIGLAWVQFGLEAAGAVDQGQIVIAALVAIAKTLIATFFFVVSFIPIIGQIIDLLKNILDLIFLVIDIILAALGIDEAALDYLIKLAIRFFYDVLPVTEIVEGFAIQNTDVTVPEAGILNGEKLVVTGQFVGRISQIIREGLTRDAINSPDRLNESSIRGSFYLTGTAPLGFVDGTPGYGVASANNFNCQIVKESSGADDPREAECTNDTRVDWVMLEARRNVSLRIAQRYDYILRVADCGFYGSVCEIFRDFTGTLPGENDDPISFELTYDFLPNTLDGFFSWTDIANLDKDADGLLDSEEAGYRTSPTEWDSDGDTLPDGFERHYQTSLGIDPAKADGDGDGVADNVEMIWGTRPDLADSDRDGATDGHETCRLDSNGDLTGFQTVVLPSGSVKVCGRPLSANDDGDALVDSAEIGLGTSPYAFNNGPGVQLIAHPHPANYLGRNITVVEPTDTVSFGVQLINVTNQPIDRPMTLCIPNNLQLNGGGTTSGARTIIPTVGTCTGGTSVTWDLTGSNQILSGELISTTIDTTALSANNRVADRPASLSVNWNSDTFSMTVGIVVDEDDPTIAIANPQDGQAIGRNAQQSTYLIRGSASDPSSWIDRVTTTLPDTTAVVGRESWETRWTLPTTDGFYTIDMTAFDVVDRTGSASATVFVDSTPPVVTSQIADVLTSSNDGNVRADIPLAGTVTDADERPRGSEVARVEISFDNGPFRSAELTEQGNSGVYNWSLTQILDIFSAQGTHSVVIRAWDGVGNVSTTTDEFIVDVSAPSDTLLDSRYENAPFPHLNTNDNATLSGLANDSGLLPAQSIPASLQGTLDTARHATTWLSPDSIGDYAGGVNVVWIGDANGDGRADAAVGLPSAENGAGKVVIVHGRAGDWPQPENAEALSDHPAYVGAAGAGIGGVVVAAGDVNGDSLFDLLIGDAVNDRFYLLLGHVGGGDQQRSLDPADSSILVFNTPFTQIAAAGDVNGDGADDIFVLNGNDLYLLNGGDLLAGVTDVAAVSGISADNIAYANGVGDVDGDNFDDFIINDTAGATRLINGRLSFGLSAQSALGDGTQLAGFQRPAVPLGDVNADGKADFLLTNSSPTLYVDGAAAATFNSRGYEAFQRGVGDVNADGCNDILLGHTDGNGFLFQSTPDGNSCTMPVESNVVVLTNVSDAAQAPYAAGADLNCDISADLLLVPDLTNTRRSELDSEGSSFVSTENLPQSVQLVSNSASQRSACTDPTTIYVNDDWAGLSGDPDGSGAATTMGCDAFATIQDALNGATSGDTIRVQGGVYEANWTHDFSGVTGVNVIGDNAETVIIDGNGGAGITIQNSNGNSFQKLTIRNTMRALSVTNSPRFDLTHSILHDFNNALWTDRISYVHLTNNTIAGGTGSGGYIVGDPNANADPALIPGWSQLNPGLGIIQSNDYPAFFNYGDDKLGVYGAVRGLAVPYLHTYLNNSWQERTHNHVPARIIGTRPVDAAGTESAGVYVFGRNIDESTAPPEQVNRPNDDFGPQIEYVGLASDSYSHWQLRGPVVEAFPVRYDGKFGIFTVTPTDDPNNHNTNAVFTLPGWDDPCNGSEKWVAPTASNNILWAMGGRFCDGNAATADNLYISTGSPNPMPAEVADQAVTALAAVDDVAAVYVGWENGYVGKTEGGVWTLFGIFCTTAPCNGTNGLPIGSIVVRPDGDLFVSNLTGNATTVDLGATSTPIRNIARFDSATATWHALTINGVPHGFGGADSDNTVDAMTQDGDTLYVAGTFDRLENMSVVFNTSADSVASFPLNVDNDATAVKTYSAPSALNPHVNRIHNITVVDAAIYIAGDFLRNGFGQQYGGYGGHSAFRWSETAQLWQAILPNERACQDPCGNRPDHVGTDIAYGDGHFYVNTVNVSGSYVTSPSEGAYASDFALFSGSLTNFELHDFTLPLMRFANPENTQQFPTASYNDAVPLTVPRLDPVEGLPSIPVINDFLPVRIATAGNDLYIALPLLVPVSIVQSAPTYHFYKFNSTTQQWERVNAGVGFGNGVSSGSYRIQDFAVTDEAIWMFDGDVHSPPHTLTRIDLASGAVSTIDSVATGRTLTWDGIETLYISRGAGNLQSYNTRTGQTNIISPPSGVNFNTQYAERWNNGWVMPQLNAFDAVWQYRPLDRRVDKIFLTDSVIVPRPSGATNFNDLSATFVDVGLAVDSAVWVEGSWTGQTVPATTITNAEAAFQDPAQALYHPTAGSVLVNKGYANFAPEAQVSLTPCGSCPNPFGSIAAAINSGTRHVLVYPGVYNESVNLPGGVTLRGLDVEQVVINGDDSGAPAVAIEGTRGAALTQVTVQGNGVVIEDGARSADIRTTLIRNATTGIRVDGSSDNITLRHLTAANNGTAVDVRGCSVVSLFNSAFTANATAVTFAQDGCANTSTQFYNAYWQNGTDLLIDGAIGQLDGTNVLQNPQFADPTNGNFRLTAQSPLIDAGFAPNSTAFVPDIGYREFLNGDVIVSPDITPTGENFGLQFGVNAFNEIQPAIDAASAAVSAFGCGVQSVGGDVCERVFTVRVLPGTYSEDVTLRSHVHLLGSGAEQTTISGVSSGRAVPAAIVLDGVTNVRVAGFGVSGLAAAISIDGASNRVTIERNLLHSSGHGVVVEGLSSAVIAHNLISLGDTGVVVSGGGNSVIINSNIRIAGLVGFSADAGNSVGHEYNIVNATTNYGGVLTANATDLVGIDPMVDGNGIPLTGSPAIDSADPRSPVPVGGGSRADIGYRERTAQPLALLFGKLGQSCVFGSVGVASNEYGIVPVDDPFATNPFGTVPANWTTFPLGTETGDRTSWALTLPALADGTYRLYTRPTDDLGNQTPLQNEWYRGTFVSDSTAPTVDITPIAATTLMTVEVAATVSDFALSQVQFTVDERVYVGELRPTSANTFTAHASVPVQAGNTTVQVTATDLAGNQTTEQIIVASTATDAPPPVTDATPPDVTIQGNVVVTDSTTLNGTATDAESGVTAVAVSLDGGSNWEAAIVNGDNWSLDWQVERNSDYRFYPVLVRATNGAGLQTTIRAANDAVQVDNVPPQFTGEASYNVPPIFHYDDGQTVTIEWIASDGDPNLTYFATANMLTRTIPTDVLASNVATVEMDQPGAWYVHLMAQDSAGNRTMQSVGPWHVAFPQQAPRSAATWTESIIIDGVIDTLHNEWLVGETVDTDSRGDESRTFYVNWDGPSLFLALGGASFPIDGELRIYFGTRSQNHLATESGLDGEALPFPTRYAVTVDSVGNGTLHEYLRFGGGWGTREDARFQALHANTNSTEIVVPRQFFGSAIAQVVATVTDLTGERTSAFPTTNGLTGDLTTFYEWRDLGSDIATRDGQPTSADLTLTATADKGTLIGLGDSVNYTVAIVNNEPVTQTNLVIGSESTIGMTSIPFQPLPDIAPNGTLSLTLTSQTGNGIPDDRLTNVLVRLAVVSTDGTVTVSADPITFNHIVDRKAPAVSVDTTETWLNATGTLFGAAVDDGVVTQVEVNDGSGWQAANGGALWQYTFNVAPRAVEQTFSVRATDQFGNVSAETPFDVPIDTTAPVVTLDLPTTISNTTRLLSGTVSDTQSGVQRVEVRVGGSTNWQTAIRTGGAWQLPFAPPTSDNGTISVTVRAIDNVDNVNTLAPQTTAIDTVAPTLQITQLVTAVAKADQPFNGSILTGTVADASGVAQLTVTHVKPNGDTSVEPIALNRMSDWTYGKALAEEGLHVFVVTATDNAGNERRSVSYLVTIEMDPTAVSVVRIETNVVWRPAWVLFLTAMVGLWVCWRRRLF